MNLVWQVICVSCRTSGPSAMHASIHLDQAKAAVAAEARLIGWAEVKDAAGGSFREWMCGRCHGALI